MTCVQFSYDNLKRSILAGNRILASPSIALRTAGGEYTFWGREDKPEGSSRDLYSTLSENEFIEILGLVRSLRKSQGIGGAQNG